VNTSSGQSLTLWPLAVYFAAVLVLAASMIALSALLGERHKDRATDEPYESGVVSTGWARLRFSANFYLIAMLFVIFDLEAVFIFAWAVAAREAGWSGYAGVVIFSGVLIAALVYEWRLGALDWASQRRAWDLPTPLVTSNGAPRHRASVGRGASPDAPPWR
jgi:NADH-quinone oxidoreductase subunit A